jgi:ABC-2 type transport system permease protein
MKRAPSDSSVAADPIDQLEKTVALDHRFNWSGLGTLFRLTLRQHIRGRRLVLLACLYALAIVVALFARLVERAPPPHVLEVIVIFYLLANAVVPLSALLCASGTIHDEVEDQTLTYLLIRPLPRRAIYLTKLLATMLMAVVLAAVFTAATYLTLNVGAPTFDAGALVGRIARAAVLMGLATVAYCAVFGYISLLTRRSLVFGVAYIILFEGLLANLDLVVRRFTVMYYFRSLSGSWLDVHQPEWNLGDPPTAGTCVLILLAASFVLATLASLSFGSREFRMKTPEGS